MLVPQPWPPTVTSLTWSAEWHTWPSAHPSADLFLFPENPVTVLCQSSLPPSSPQPALSYFLSLNWTAPGPSMSRICPPEPYPTLSPRHPPVPIPQFPSLRGGVWCLLQQAAFFSSSFSFRKAIVSLPVPNCGIQASSLPTVSKPAHWAQSSSTHGDSGQTSWSETAGLKSCIFFPPNAVQFKRQRETD